MFDPGAIGTLLIHRDEERRRIKEARRAAEARRARNAEGGLARSLGRGLRALADRLDLPGRSTEASPRTRDASYEPCC